MAGEFLMRIEKVTIENFKSFKDRFEVSFNDGVNILVGNNESGKSTILEAVHLALTGILNGRYLRNELSQYLFNIIAVDEYLASLKTEEKLSPPAICIQVFIAGEECPSLGLIEGSGHDEGTDRRYGIRYAVEFDPAYANSYEALINAGNVESLPIEFYTVKWTAFSRDSITSRNIPLKPALIDSSLARYQNGSDIFISRIVRNSLSEDDKVAISQAHRKLRQDFMDDESVKAVNTKISGEDVTNKPIQISVDMATQNAWEASLMTYLDRVPFHYIGKGEQSIVKASLALSHDKAEEASVLLIEEPENHLSHTKLNELLKRISSRSEGKQVIVTTHNSFVANKLGLNNLVLLNNHSTLRLNELSGETFRFFQKLNGYDTLRLILCERAILVEGDSDELVVQRAYMDANDGRLPIEANIDVVSVKLAFLRFLEIAERLDLRVDVITDTDGDLDAIQRKYVDYIGDNKKPNINIYFDEEIDEGDIEGFNYNTLEPKLLKANDLAALNRVFGKTYEDENALLIHMQANKTECALKIFEATESINYPAFISNAVGAANGE